MVRRGASPATVQVAPPSWLTEKKQGRWATTVGGRCMYRATRFSGLVGLAAIEVSQWSVPAGSEGRPLILMLVPNETARPPVDWASTDRPAAARSPTTRIGNRRAFARSNAQETWRMAHLPPRHGYAANLSVLYGPKTGGAIRNFGYAESCP